MDFQTNPSPHSGVLRVRKRSEKEWTVVMHGDGGKPWIKRESNCGFSWDQLLQLKHQTLIYSHLVSGLPIPLRLLAPISKTLLPPLSTSIFNPYPFTGFSPQGFHCKNMVDPEPGRCRRTDGKKWRCSKNVVHDQKYCEQHMHRGRQRSRKLVEVAEIGTSLSNTKMPDKSISQSLQNSNSNIPVSVGLQLMTTLSSNITSVSHANTTPSSSFSTKRVTNVIAPCIATTNTAAITKSNKNVGNAGNDVGDKYFGTIGRSNNNNIHVGRHISQGLGFSPKSVLHLQELEPGRCRRTDGKKWRCRRDVIPDQKYCARHMHRGAKKLVKVFPPLPCTASSAATDSAPCLPATAISCRVDPVSPDTKLSISIQASPQLTNIGEKSDSSTSSDTTISDTSIAAYTITKLPA
ncbi:growth-regulating factor 9 isoform X2 [Humulus lupulus]|uniref:growth-regulating factor 9 isoform X2 n=1 Tax=Humulus lupulus TaxID=3486 RepID=UPI002B416230|nr:growth-regulating factor 9 isoform X2 [Humulus lupulus]